MDLLCFEDVDLFATELVDPIGELEQDVFHMLLEKPGSNPDDVARGAGLEDALSGTRSDQDIQHDIEGSLLRDDRIDAATVIVSRPRPDTMSISIEIEPDGSLDLEITRNGVRRVG